MRRCYISRARIAFDEVWQDPAAPPALTVYEVEAEPVFTGLYDANGVPLYATTEREPIGFRVTKEAD